MMSRSLRTKVDCASEMPEKELEKKKSRGDDSGGGDGRTRGTANEESVIEVDGKGCSFRPIVVSGLKVGLQEGDFDRVVGIGIRACRSSCGKWCWGRIDSYDGIGKKHRVEYEDGKTEEIDLTRREFVLESGSRELLKSSVDLQARLIEPTLTAPRGSKAAKSKPAGRWMSGKKPKMEKRGMRREEEMSKALLTRTPAATFKSVELDDRTSAKVIRKRVKVYSFDEENWMMGRIISYDKHRRHHLVAFEDGNTTEMDLQAQLCMVELRYEEATALLSPSSHECHCF